jgi:hypothetical protein
MGIDGLCPDGGAFPGRCLDRDGIALLWTGTALTENGRFDEQATDRSNEREISEP